MHRFITPLETKRADSAGRVEGYGSTYEIDSTGERIAPGAFARSIAAMRSGGRQPAMLWHHQGSQPIGVWTELQEDTRGLRVVGKIATDTVLGREAHVLAKAGALHLSVGFVPRKVTPDANGVRTITDLELLEISLVSMPANTGATIIHVKSSEGGVSMKSEHRILFERWLRDPRGSVANELIRYGRDQKDINVGTSAEGGFAVPIDLARDIDVQVSVANPFRLLHGAERRATSERYTLPLAARGAGAAWAVDDVTPRSGAESTPTFRDQSPSFGEIYARPLISEWAADDTDLTEWLTNVAGDDLGAAEADAIVRGDGSRKITDFLHTAPRLTIDTGSPIDDSSLQYIPVGGGGLIDALIDVVAAVRPRYLAAPTTGWVMHPDALAAVRKAQKTAGRSVLIEATTEGAPPMLLSWPVHTTEAMDAPGASPPVFPVAFGNWRRGFALVDRTEMRVGIEGITAPGWHRFFVRRRVGGRVYDNRAIKLVSF